MVMLIGKPYTKLSDTFLGQDKEYVAQAKLGVATDTYDCDGEITTTHDKIPTLAEVQHVLQSFQGDIQQVPPMYSAKKIGGKKLYELAREGKTIERAPVNIHVTTTLVRYEYPFLELRITCSKGTYIRSIAHEIGILLGCGAHLTALQRTRSGPFTLEACTTLEALSDPSFNTSQLTIDTQGILSLNH
jgi:tRNA pseudouridine55 synthase